MKEITLEITLEIVEIELKELKKNLKNGDKIITQISPSGKEIKFSEKVGKARVNFQNLIKGLIKNKSINTEQGTRATQLFGRRTAKMHWK